MNLSHSILIASFCIVSRNNGMIGVYTIIIEGRVSWVLVKVGVNSNNGEVGGRHSRWEFLHVHCMHSERAGLLF
jgi:hypothetical protein